MIKNLGGQFQQHFESDLVSNSGSVLADGNSEDALQGDAIGIFPFEVNCSSDELLSASKPTYGKYKRWAIKQAVDQVHDPINLVTSNEPFTTTYLDAASIISVQAIPATSYQEVPEIVAFGYDGMDATKSVRAYADYEAYVINVILQGAPIRRIFGDNKKVFRVIVDKNHCKSTCSCPEDCTEINPETLIDAALDQLSKAYAFGAGPYKAAQVFLHELIDFKKTKMCTTPSVPLTVVESMKQYTMTICEDKGYHLGAISAKYPLGGVKLVSYDGTTSTYEMWLKSTDPIPTDFTVKSYVTPICDTCPTCPDPHTKINGGRVVQVRVSCGSAAPVLTGEITKTLVTSTLRGGDVYLITVPITDTDAAIEAQLTGCKEYSFVGVKGALCVSADKVFQWKDCGKTCGRVEKEYMIRIPDGVCGEDDHLPMLTKAYPNTTITEITGLPTNACFSAYKIKVKSDCLGEETCGKEIDYKFERPAPYKGIFWEEVAPIVTTPTCTTPAAATPPCCVYGIIAIGKTMKQPPTSCATVGYVKWDDEAGKPFTIQMNSVDERYTASACDTMDAPFTRLQKGKLYLPTNGLFVQGKEMDQLRLNNRAFTFDPVMREAIGSNLKAIPNALYDQIVINYRIPFYGNSFLTKHQEGCRLTVWVKKGAGAAILEAFNSLALSTGNPNITAASL